MCENNTIQWKIIHLQTILGKHKGFSTSTKNPGLVILRIDVLHGMHLNGTSVLMGFPSGDGVNQWDTDGKIPWK